ncbi:MAG TPA: hypothetical protein DEG18_03340 [Candidatus Yanofskybacteria bacterium]|nr:MAG: hypothetical protein A2371_00645 [Candidatus Yanofskybacteria bacterium RIFOXYB1_FULL_44_29]HBX58616.1 hypothetical protein [Candidatus Yanofskybacteria bacterium]
MTKLYYIRLTTITFAVLGIIHLFKGITGVPLTLNSWQAPICVSYVESLLFLSFAYLGFRQWQDR